MAEAATASANAPAHRTLPHNLKAERSVLGAILIDNDSMNVAAAMIDSKAFFRDAHRRIFEKMLDLSERSQPIDLVMLKEELERSGDLEEVGGPAYIASLVDGVPRSTNVEYYAQIVKEKATLRNLIFSANKILGSAYEADQEADLILDEAESSIFSVAEDRIKAGRNIQRPAFFFAQDVSVLETIIALLRWHQRRQPHPRNNVRFRTISKPSDRCWARS